ncbi:Glutathione S-transferase [Psilocybe cubensis]|uniref:Glutathione S-transferase n=2 Tax=Psilocybe cubensis TaxID=181762 RepID=A0ACB8H0X2_PSICU|nr:Glutathione S-transferase [Psilocybe cubensis]KAH9481136.1 Glutathione S-transferase [Psilocybe cubensis]
MVLTLYGNPMTTCTWRVATVLKEKQVPFILKEVNLLKGEHKSADFLEKQPFGVVPCIDDDGFILYESRAICQYIAAKYANQGTPGLIPDFTDFAAYALFQQASSIEQAYFNEYAEKAVVEKVFKPKYGVVGNVELADKLLATLETKLDVYEKILSKQKYLVGNSVTLADLYHLPYGSLLKDAGASGLDSPTRPNVARWWNDISSRESWQSVKDGVIP